MTTFASTSDDTPVRTWIGSSSNGHLVACACIGLAVGYVSSRIITYAYDPIHDASALDLSSMNALGCVLLTVLLMGPTPALLIGNPRLLAAVALAGSVGILALGGLHAATRSGEAAGGSDRVLAWTALVTAVYAVAGALTAPRVRLRHVAATTFRSSFPTSPDSSRPACGSTGPASSSR